MGEKHELHKVNQATDSEIDAYMEIEEKLVKEGKIKMTRQELQDELTSLKDFHDMRRHEFIHVFTFVAGCIAFFFGYQAYSENDVLTTKSIILLCVGVVLWVITWIIFHPRFKHEKEINEYYKKHWEEFGKINQRHYPKPSEIAQKAEEKAKSAYKNIIYPLGDDDSDEKK